MLREWGRGLKRLGAGIIIGALLAAVASGQDIRLQPAENNHVAIPRAALGKEFLMSASLIPQSGAPTSTGLGGRIVYFELFADGVDMYDSPQGQVVTTDLPARRLLTTFPIVEQHEDRIVIDFNKGMRRVFTGTWYSDRGFQPEADSVLFEVPQSRVFEVRQGEQRLMIRQSAQVRSRQRNADEEARYEVRYFLSPYQPSDFKPKETLAREERYIRYFEVAPQLELNSGRSTSHVARFDIRQPIVFFYSANTPPEYEQAVRDGILYWNRAFGSEILRAEKAPPEVTAPSPDYNVVQWVPYDNAGFAYADALLDPRTGQTLHGQAYITSVFALSGKQRARALLRTLAETVKEAEGKEGEGEKSLEQRLEHLHTHHSGHGDERFGIDFLKPDCACRTNSYLFARQMIDGLETMLAQGNVSDAKILEASQDYVRNVVAHEVGHVLGLRHNFAGSLEGNVTPAELHQWFADYLTKESPPEMKDKLTTSSVMEYSDYPAAVFNGWKIRTTDTVLPYDRAAIQWGYMDSNEPKEKKLLFGTDDDLFRYGDLRVFDFGPEPVVSAFSQISRKLKNLPNSIIERYIDYKAPLDPRDARPLEEVPLDVSSAVFDITLEYNTIFRWFQASTRSIRLERDLPYTDELNREERLKKLWDSLNEQVKKAGGIDRLVFSILPLNLSLNLKETPQGVTPPEKFDAEKLHKRLAELLDSPAYSSFVGADGKTYSFTDEEKELIKKRAKDYFAKYESELIKAVCQTLGRASRDLGSEVNGGVSDDDIVAQLEKQIIAVARAVIMAKDDSKRRRGTNKKAIVEVIDFKYDLETRMAAAQMLSDSVGSFRAWSKEQRSNLHNELKSEVEAALNIGDFKSFNDSQLSRSVREWYLDQQRVLQLLPQAPGSS